MSTARDHRRRGRGESRSRSRLPAPLRPGRPGVAAGAPRAGRHLDHLPVPERPLPVGDQPDQPDAADHGRRPDLGRHRLRAAARRDRPVGRRGQRPVPRPSWRCSTSSTAGTPTWRSPPACSTGAAIGLLQGAFFTRLRGAVVRGHAGRPAGLAGRAALRAGRHRHGQPQRRARSPAWPTRSTPTRSGWIARARRHRGLRGRHASGATGERVKARAGRPGAGAGRSCGSWWWPWRSWRSCRSSTPTAASRWRC